MTSDEIRQHLEMLLADAQTRNRDIEQLYESVSGLERTAKEHNASLQTDAANIHALTLIVRAQTESIAALERIATAHESRLDAIQGDDAASTN